MPIFLMLFPQLGFGYRECLKLEVPKDFRED
jgi:hypothetical protein